MNTIPTLQQLYTDILTDLETSFGNSIPLFGKNWLRAQAIVQAAKIKLIYLSLGNLQKNIFVDTAESESIGGTLERFGRVKLGRNPFPAQAGEYEIEITGEIGAVINALTTFKSDDDTTNPGKLFILDTLYTLVSTTDSITVRALEAGVLSKMEAGETMTATIPIAGVNKSAEVLTEITQPLAAETLEAYRQVAIDSYRTEPQGGAAADYRIWAADAQGVARVYPYATDSQTAEVDLFIEATIADSTDGKGTPSAGLISDVEDVVEMDPDTSKPLNERGRRPLGVFQVNYLPVTIKDIDIEINDFVGGTPAIETTIFNALKAALDEIRPFVASADILEDRNDTIDSNKIIAIILNARPGSVFGTVQLYVDGSPLSTYTFTLGNIPYLDDVTYP